MDCSKVNTFLKPLFENRMPLDESIALKDHIVSCNECYNKLSNEEKVSLEIYKMPRIPMPVNTDDILKSIRNHENYNIIRIKATKPGISRRLSKVAGFLIFAFFSAYFIFISMKGPVGAYVSSQFTRVENNYNQSKIIERPKINPNIKRIDQIQIINDLIPYYSDETLMRKMRVSAETVF